MANSRQKSKNMGRQQWIEVVNRYYNGEDPYVIANSIKSNPSLVFDHIKKDKRARAKKGLPPRVRKEYDVPKEEYVIPKENNISIKIGELIEMSEISTTEEKLEEEVTEMPVVEEKTEVAEEVITTTTEKVKKKHRGGRKLEIPENFIEVYNAYSNKQDGLFTLNDAAKRLGVSPATFGRWRAAYKEYLEKQQNPQIKEYIEEKTTIEEPYKMPFMDEPKSEGKEEVAESIIELSDIPTVQKDSIESIDTAEKDDESMTLVFEDRPVYKAGLVADRHPMPVDVYIFPKALDKNLMWDYNSQDRVVEQFILKNIGTRKNAITGKREAKQDMILYVSGIQCCLCSVIKQCYAYGINLTVMHYDNDKDVYHPQHVIVGKRAGVEDMFKSNRLQLLKCKFKDITESIDYYSIKKIKYNKDGKAIYIDEIVSPYMNDIYSLTIDMVKDILMNREDKYRICLNRATIKDNKEKELERILDTKNWK